MSFNHLLYHGKNQIFHLSYYTILSYLRQAFYFSQTEIVSYLALLCDTGT